MEFFVDYVWKGNFVHSEIIAAAVCTIEKISWASSLDIPFVAVPISSNLPFIIELCAA
ncbi:hypothetical protein D9M68_876760 [compost metagenome]